MADHTLTLLVGGATGMVGRELVPYLSKHYPNVFVRALTRVPDSEAAHQLAQLPRVEIVKGDYGDRQSLQQAAAGVDRAYVACNNVPKQFEFECNFIDACQNSGVSRLLKLAVPKYICFDNAPGHGATHYNIIQHLKQSQLPFAVIHPSYFFQSLLYLTYFIKMEGRLPHLLGDSKQNMIDCRDLAQYIAVLLTCQDELFAPFIGQGIEIAGPEKLGGEDWAVALQREGVAVHYEKVTPEQERDNFLALGLPEELIEIIVTFHTHFYDGSIPIPDQQPTASLAALPGVPETFRRFDNYVKEIAPMLKADGA